MYIKRCVNYSRNLQLLYLNDLLVLEIASAPQRIPDIGNPFGNFDNQTGFIPGMNGGSINPGDMMQNRTDGLPGYNYYEEIQSQTFMPSIGGDESNSTGNGLFDRFQGQTGNLNNQTSQVQGCVPDNIGGNGN